LTANAHPPKTFKMDAVLPKSAPLPASQAAAFEVRRPADDRARPLIFASPHSGRIYPEAMMAASVLDAGQIRRSEDALVDRLIEAGPDHGASLLLGRYARAFLDVNREPYELDPAMFEDELPDFARGQTARVAAGLGAIARIVADGQEIYGRKLRFAEARERIEAVHGPYHAALQALIEDLKGRFGKAVVIDWHSMPSAAARTAQGRTCDIVLGDRFGAACAGEIIDTAETVLAARGYRVARNSPYAGGFTTERYGRPDENVHALQVEINRALYLDEAAIAPTAGFDTLKTDLEALFAALAERV
jgi:N-formylglutamate amidohydrolase